MIHCSVNDVLLLTCRDSTRLSKSEFDLLDSSALFSEHENGDSSALDIDDEELMNEMEELLA